MLSLLLCNVFSLCHELLPNDKPQFKSFIAIIIIIIIIYLFILINFFMLFIIVISSVFR